MTTHDVSSAARILFAHAHNLVDPRGLGDDLPSPADFVRRSPRPTLDEIRSRLTGETRASGPLRGRAFEARASKLLEGLLEVELGLEMVGPAARARALGTLPDRFRSAEGVPGIVLSTGDRVNVADRLRDLRQGMSDPIPEALDPTALHPSSFSSLKYWSPEYVAWRWRSAFGWVEACWPMINDVAAQADLLGDDLDCVDVSSIAISGPRNVSFC